MLLTQPSLLRNLVALTICGLLVAISGVDLVPRDAAAANRTRYSFTRAEKCMMRKINKRRKNQGRKPLAWDRQLGYVARKHARKMARNRTIFHDNGLGSKVTRWRRLGQNVGMGRGCHSLFKMFMRSSPHRHNIMGRFRHVGVGSKVRNGKLYVMHVFESRRDPGNIYNYP